MGRPGIRHRHAVIRGLTPGECALIRTEFGPDLGLDEVRLLAGPWPLGRAFVPGRWFRRDWVVWPRRSLPCDLSTAPLSLQAVLIHEMVHVWQARSGVNLLAAKLRAGDGPEAYRYPPRPCDWSGLNIEQQAMTVEHRFRAARGQRVPADAGHYAALCPVRPTPSA